MPSRPGCRRCRSSASRSHEDFDGYLLDVAAKLKAEGIRVEVDTSDDRMQKKIRNAQKQKVPFMLIAGADDIAAGAVSFRFRDGTQDNGIPVDEAIARIVAAVRDRRVTDDRTRSGAGGAARCGIRAFERLYTPHRMAYIKGEGKGDGLPVLRDPGMADDEDGLIVARGDHVYAVLNLYPYNSGHLMVVPVPARRRLRGPDDRGGQRDRGADPAGDPCDPARLRRARASTSA